MSTRDRILALVVPAIAAVIVATAVVRFHEVHQSSWQGAGFGMFATYEYEPGRSLRVMGRFGDIEQAVPIPEELHELVGRVLVAPGDPEAVELADRLRELAGADSVTVRVLTNTVHGEGDGLVVGMRVLRTVEVP